MARGCLLGIKQQSVKIESELSSWLTAIICAHLQCAPSHNEKKDIKMAENLWDEGMGMGLEIPFVEEHFAFEVEGLYAIEGVGGDDVRVEGEGDVELEDCLIVVDLFAPEISAVLAVASGNTFGLNHIHIKIVTLGIVLSYDEIVILDLEVEIESIQVWIFVVKTWISDEINFAELPLVFQVIDWTNINIISIGVEFCTIGHEETIGLRIGVNIHSIIRII